MIPLEINVYVKPGKSFTSFRGFSCIADFKECLGEERVKKCEIIDTDLHASWQKIIIRNGLSVPDKITNGDKLTYNNLIFQVERHYQVVEPSFSGSYMANLKPIREKDIALCVLDLRGVRPRVLKHHLKPVCYFIDAAGRYGKNKDTTD